MAYVVSPRELVLWSYVTGKRSNPRVEAPHKPLPVYNWYPAVLARANASAERLAYLLRQHLVANASSSLESLKEWINTQLIMKHLGITDALESELTDLASNPANLTWHFSRLVSRRAHIGWSTHGHTVR